jgi:hypothetical protein
LEVLEWTNRRTDPLQQPLRFRYKDRYKKLCRKSL